MPQLDVTLFAPQIVWLIITFLAMYFLMAKVALPNIAEVLEERQTRIDDNLEKAAALKKEAEDAAAAYESSLAEARSKAQDEVKVVLDAANAAQAKAQDELAAKLETKLTEAEARIAEAKDKALANINEVSGDVAKATVEKLTGVSVDDAAVNAAVAKAMETN
ncbi:ATP synthase subunit b' [Candidatus Terasakiella magnetica]|uniref:ATP synthase subunit b n=1 Tax=Candidatus Terasakiella magnetica TaxID=1867952 RepID=A0A1C3RJC0_9PROT|nr:F0F1 ATP synthase subunit B' [Candidatus Terasakiella magnetica]SCA57368.1 ATP synthase subunit b' [Candidatus Terasakiella magnetica]